MYCMFALKVPCDWWWSSEEFVHCVSNRSDC